MKLKVAYIFALLLFLPGVLGLFEASMLGLSSVDAILYIKMSSVFITIVAFLLCWYFANLIVRQKVVRKACDFGFSIIDIDFEKILQDDLPKVAENVAKNLGKYERCQFEFLGFCIPFLMMFLILCAFGLYGNVHSIFAYVIGCSLIYILVKLSSVIASICNIQRRQSSIKEVLHNLALNTKGIQFFNSTYFVRIQLREAEKLFVQNTKEDVTNFIWRSFAYICLVFLTIVIAYIANKEFIYANLLEISGITAIYMTSLCMFFLFLVTLYHHRAVKDITFHSIEKYNMSKEDTGTQKGIDDKNLFIAFHGVYFKEPTRLSSQSIINNLTFSVMPGEFIAITGENGDAYECIFDLLMGFYRPQSGQIYIAGQKIDTISREQLRSFIGVFDENFGLIRGTIYDNLVLLGNARNHVLAIAENVGLSEIMEKPIYDDTGNLTIGQEVLFRIQIARIALRKPKIMLVKSPDTFESTENEEMFNEFIEFYRNRCTMLAATTEATHIIYSSKILYLSSQGNLFGTHAELLKHKRYQRYMKEKCTKIYA